MNVTGLSKSGVRYALTRLRESGMVTREGTRKTENGSSDNEESQK